MTEIDKFQIENTLAIVEDKIVNDSNSCELNYYLGFREYLKRLLEKE